MPNLTSLPAVSTDKTQFNPEAYGQSGQIGGAIASISAVLPAHNEAANIEQVVEATCEALRGVVSDYEVIIVDDGSTDETPRLADSLAERYPQVRVVHHPHNRGYGSAWRSGIAAAAKQYIFFLDSDRQFDPREIGLLVQWGTSYDIVAGYRIHRNDPLYRTLNASCFHLLVRLLFGVHVRDLDCGFKLFRASLLKGMPLESPGALINAEIHYFARVWQATLREVGVHHFPRKAGKQSGASLRVVLRAASELVALRRRMTQRSLSSSVDASPTVQ